MKPITAIGWNVMITSVLTGSPVDENDVSSLLYTSGTTGNPKG